MSLTVLIGVQGWTNGLLFKTWRLQYPQCNLTTERHHQKQFTRFHTAIKNDFIHLFFFFHICSSNSPRPVNKRQSVKLVELPFKNWCTVFYKNIIVTRKKPHIRFNRFKGFHYINLGEIIRLGQVFLSNLPSFALHARWEQLQMALRMCLHSCSSGVFINFNKGPRPRCHRGVKHISGVFNLSPFYVIPKTDLCLFFCFFFGLSLCLPGSLLTASMYKHGCFLMGEVDAYTLRVVNFHFQEN